MPMFDDPQKALNRLQRELLEEEETYGEEYVSEEEWLEDELAEAKAMLGMEDEEEEDEEPEIYRNFANGYGNYQPADLYDYDDGDDFEEAEELPPKGPGGQMFLTVLLLTGIIAVALYWVAVLL